MKRVVVGLSGGVDSSVAAYLLKEQGYEVIGMFMRNWHDESVTINNECPWIDDSNDALIVAEKLGIPFQVIDLSKEYKERIVDYMFSEYERGRTPNPDVLCNREIKFDIFLKTAMRLNADYVRPLAKGKLEAGYQFNFTDRYETFNFYMYDPATGETNFDPQFYNKLHYYRYFHR